MKRLAATNDEIAQIARMLDLRKSCLKRRLEHCNWVAGAQVKPGTRRGCSSSDTSSVNSILRYPHREGSS